MRMIMICTPAKISSLLRFKKGEDKILEINYRIIRLSEILKLELRYDYWFSKTTDDSDHSKTLSMIKNKLNPCG